MARAEREGPAVRAACSAAIETEPFEDLRAIIAIERAPTVGRAGLCDRSALPLVAEEEM